MCLSSGASRTIYKNITDLPRQAARRNERATNPRNREDTALAARCQRRAHPASPLVLGQGLCLRVPALSQQRVMVKQARGTAQRPPFYRLAVLQNGRGVPSRRCSAPDGNRRCLPIDLRSHRFGRAQKLPPSCRIVGNADDSQAKLVPRSSETHSLFEPHQAQVVTSQHWHRRSFSHSMASAEILPSCLSQEKRGSNAHDVLRGSSHSDLAPHGRARQSERQQKTVPVYLVWEGMVRRWRAHQESLVWTDPGRASSCRSRVQDPRLTDHRQQQRGLLEETASPNRCPHGPRTRR
mmetsp:Transcript_63911/g.169130  ORF Transcript_63911/g.169130 Transcript_63911/m.169130 type:complete len:294 (+) Transcript_63911:250-1131(+)